jgi:Ca2+-binding EF-hand superfamily protein
MNGKIIVFVAGLALASGAALAGDRGDRPDFASLDTDGDGQLSEAELDSLPGRRNRTGADRLARLDTDGDGYVSQDELEQARQHMRSGKGGKHGGRPDFESLDTNADELLSADELDQLPSRGGRSGADRLARLDSDDDGYVSREELEQARQHMRSGKGGKHGGRPNFENFDTDGDGQLSRDEMSQMKGPRGSPPPEVFDRMDADGDGYVTRDEMQSMRKQRKGQGGPSGMPEGGNHFFRGQWGQQWDRHHFKRVAAPLFEMEPVPGKRGLAPFSKRCSRTSRCLLKWSQSRVKGDWLPFLRDVRERRAAVGEKGACPRFLRENLSREKGTGSLF